MNFQKGWKGYLWQSRFSSFSMDEAYLMNCTRYVELNPVRAKLCTVAQDWPWSSALSHIEGKPDGICKPTPLLERFDSWIQFLEEGISHELTKLFQKSENSNRPFGSEEFIRKLEAKTGMDLVPKKRGPKPKDK
jgi:putative transposase